MKLCRFQTANGPPRVGVLADETSVLDITSAGVASLETLLEMENFTTHMNRLAGQTQTRYGLRNVKLLPPVDRQEVWAAGVTYQRSKTARMEESETSASIYDKVYDAPRPELFFKAVPEKVVAPNDAVGIRKDATWSVPEPELALVFNSKGRIVGYTIGNDMSSRDIEGQNPLYLPQAKVYRQSCALGPAILLEENPQEHRAFDIELLIQRGKETAFSGKTSTAQMKRTFGDLAEWLEIGRAHV